MGIVFKALDTRTGETLAVKLSLDHDSAQRRQIEREFIALQRVRHPHIVAAKAAFLDVDDPFFTMECIEGQRFDAWVRPNGMLDPTRVRAALRNLTSALVELHDKGMVHCDLKPGNVLFTSQGRAVLLDFGLVTYVDGSADAVPTDAEIYGTPDYMAPEQAAGDRLSHAADTYALGVMLYQALTDTLPFEGNLSALLWARQRSLPIAPSERCSGVPADLDALCLDLMALDPKQRPTAAMTLARLKRL